MSEYIEYQVLKTCLYEYKDDKPLSELSHQEIEGICNNKADWNKDVNDEHLYSVDGWRLYND
jgi:hypothetical protein